MENLYIQIVNGQPVNNPATEENLMQALGQIPSDWEPFKRGQQPTPKVYEVLDDHVSIYQKVDGQWTDVWFLRDMTQEEIEKKQSDIHQWWNAQINSSNYSAWTFDSKICWYKPPVPMPIDGKHYFWQGSSNTWVEYPPYPDDGKEYGFNILTGTWVEFTPTV